MKKLLVVAVLCASAAPLSAETFQIDPVHSAITFKVRHMMVSNVGGRFGKFSGSFDYEKGKPKTWKTEATIDPASLNTDNEQRDGHLKSPDFFDVAKCPVMSFKSTKVVAVKGDMAKLYGDLTMHCITKPVILDLEIVGTTSDAKGSHAGATATGTIHRKDFDMVWNKTLDAGGVALSDDVQITIEVEGGNKKG